MSRLTGGVVTDLTTAMFAGVGILAVLLGFDLLKEWFEISISNRSSAAALDDARQYRILRNRSAAYSAEREYYNELYYQSIKKAARLHTGRPSSVSSSRDLSVDLSCDPGRFE